MQAGVDGVRHDFRHALIRDALYDQVPLPRRRELHARVAEAAISRGYTDAVISAHFDAAGLGTPAYRHATTAARAAAGVSAHREALILYRRALHNLPTDSAAEQADSAGSARREASAVDDNDAAAGAYTRAHALRLQPATLWPRLP